MKGGTRRIRRKRRERAANQAAVLARWYALPGNAALLAEHDIALSAVLDVRLTVTRHHEGYTTRTLEAVMSKDGVQRVVLRQS